MATVLTFLRSPLIGKLSILASFSLIKSANKLPELIRALMSTDLLKIIDRTYPTGCLSEFSLTACTCDT